MAQINDITYLNESTISVDAEITAEELLEAMQRYGGDAVNIVTVQE